MLEQQGLLGLLERLNDVQILLLLQYAVFPKSRDSFDEFRTRAIGQLLNLEKGRPSSQEERDALTMYEHFDEDLARLGLRLDRDAMGKARSHDVLTRLGWLLVNELRALGTSTGTSDTDDGQTASSESA
jgi:hypothetical protein